MAIASEQSVIPLRGTRAEGRRRSRWTLVTWLILAEPDEVTRSCSRSNAGQCRCDTAADDAERGAGGVGAPSQRELAEIQARETIGQ